VCEFLADKKTVPVKRIGIPDRFGETASLDWLLEQGGMTANHIVSAVLAVKIQAGI
jgi:transketolase C-terminal domain/subunit